MNDPNRKDTLGTHIDEYMRRFNIPLVSARSGGASAANAPAAAPAFAPEECAPPVQLASLGGMPTPDTAPAPDPAARDMVAQALAAQQQPAPPPQQVAQAAPLPVQPVQCKPRQFRKRQCRKRGQLLPVQSQNCRDYIEGDPALRQQMERAGGCARPAIQGRPPSQAQKQYEELEKRAKMRSKTNGRSGTNAPKVRRRIQAKGRRASARARDTPDSATENHYRRANSSAAG